MVWVALAENERLRGIPVAKCQRRQCGLTVCGMFTSDGSVHWTGNTSSWRSINWPASPSLCSSGATWSSPASEHWTGNGRGSSRKSTTCSRCKISSVLEFRNSVQQQLPIAKNNMTTLQLKFMTLYLRQNKTSLENLLERRSRKWCFRQASTPRLFGLVWPFPVS